jgi:hypothetical protein
MFKNWFWKICFVLWTFTTCASKESKNYNLIFKPKSILKGTVEQKKKLIQPAKGQLG